MAAVEEKFTDYEGTNYYSKPMTEGEIIKKIGSWFQRDFEPSIDCNKMVADVYGRVAYRVINKACLEKTPHILDYLLTLPEIDLTLPNLDNQTPLEFILLHGKFLGRVLGTNMITSIKIQKKTEII